MSDNSSEEVTRKNSVELVSGDACLTEPKGFTEADQQRLADAVKTTSVNKTGLGYSDLDKQKPCVSDFNFTATVHDASLELRQSMCENTLQNFAKSVKSGDNSGTTSNVNELCALSRARGRTLIHFYDWQKHLVTVAKQWETHLRKKGKEKKKSMIIGTGIWGQHKQQYTRRPIVNRRSRSRSRERRIYYDRRSRSRSRSRERRRHFDQGTTREYRQYRFRGDRN